MPKLTLDNFDESSDVKPILNSPRSLEACMRVGVTPEELIRRPITYFRGLVRGRSETQAKLRLEHYEQKRKENLATARAERENIVMNEPNFVPLNKLFTNSHPSQARNPRPKTAASKEVEDPSQSHEVQSLVRAVTTKGRLYQSMLDKLRKRDSRYEEIELSRKQEMNQRAAERELKHLEKRDSVEKKQRMDEYNRLKLMEKLERERLRIESIQQEQQRLLKERKEARSKAQRAREQLQEELRKSMISGRPARLPKGMPPSSGSPRRGL